MTMSRSQLFALFFAGLLAFACFAKPAHADSGEVDTEIFCKIDHPNSVGDQQLDVTIESKLQNNGTEHDIKFRMSSDPGKGLRVRFEDESEGAALSTNSRMTVVFDTLSEVPAGVAYTGTGAFFTTSLNGWTNISDPGLCVEGLFNGVNSTSFIVSPASLPGLVLSCYLPTLSTTAGVLAIGQFEFKCDLQISGYVYNTSGSDLALGVIIGFSSESETNNDADDHCDDLTGEVDDNNDNVADTSICVPSAGSTSTDGSGAVFAWAPTATINTVDSAVLTFTQTFNASGDIELSDDSDDGVSVFFTFQTAGSSDVFWDPKMGVAFTPSSSASALTVAPLLLAALLALLATLLL
jgi:hypothetical protein